MLALIASHIYDRRIIWRPGRPAHGLIVPGYLSVVAAIAAHYPQVTSRFQRLGIDEPKRVDDMFAIAANLRAANCLSFQNEFRGCKQFLLLFSARPGATEMLWLIRCFVSWDTKFRGCALRPVWFAQCYPPQEHGIGLLLQED